VVAPLVPVPPVLDSQLRGALMTQHTRNVLTVALLSVLCLTVLCLTAVASGETPIFVDGPDLKTLYITAGGTLWSIRTRVPGHPAWPDLSR
jgi:hypothetical protein